MSLFRWGSEHEIYLPEIDAEHRGLFLAGEELHRALAAGATAERLKEALHNLLQLAEAHFLHEERLMRDSGFASYEWHRRQHDSVRRRAKELAAADRLSVTAALDFLASWLRDHTAVADRIMAAHVRNWSRRKAA
ncbi:MAG: hemerythrin family protein [Acidobacteriota bacterium]|nr:hemerythrin family protein [Acidobacteriota bacterium]